MKEAEQMGYNHINIADMTERQKEVTREYAQVKNGLFENPNELDKFNLLEEQFYCICADIAEKKNPEIIWTCAEQETFDLLAGDREKILDMIGG